ncbi:MAG: LysR family transcriptional regulator [Zetaproteobacteria bacterium CG12_big_fil_rev_8_21_14_0_65_55_1124]|nr:MAG: LysR family transcriptional regulator [Zetaproteobacteria bacterium CG12_big_fil_rev_8_21_14_0_65_55_1124]
MNTRLFERSKSGVQLTPAGLKLASRSRNLLREWQDIRQEVGQGSSDSILVRLGAPGALWQARLLAATADFCRSRPNMHFVLKTGGRRELATMLIGDELDCVVLPEQLAYPGFESRRVAVLRLIPVATPDIPADEAVRFSHFVEVDWGDSFRDRLEQVGVLLPVAAVQINVAWLGLDWLLRTGGTAWLPQHLVRAHIEAGRLVRIPGPETVNLDVYAAFNQEHIGAEAMVRALRDSMAEVEG